MNKIIASTKRFISQLMTITFCIAFLYETYKTGQMPRDLAIIIVGIISAYMGYSIKNDGTVNKINGE